MRMHPDVTAVEERVHVGAQEEAVVDPVLTVSSDGADVRSLQHRYDHRSSRMWRVKPVAIPCEGVDRRSLQPSPQLGRTSRARPEPLPPARTRRASCHPVPASGLGEGRTAPARTA
jgi:hypothetical protein